MLKLAFSWLTGGGFGMLLNLYSRYKDSKDKGEKLQADWAKARLDAMMANRTLTAGFAEMRVLTFFIALPFVVHVNLVGLDTCFGFGWGIAKWPAPFDEYEGKILLSFFGLTAGAIAIKAITGVFRR